MRRCIIIWKPHPVVASCQPNSLIVYLLCIFSFSPEHGTTHEIQWRIACWIGKYVLQWIKRMENAWCHKFCAALGFHGRRESQHKPPLMTYRCRNGANASIWKETVPTTHLCSKISHGIVTIAWKRIRAHWTCSRRSRARVWRCWKMKIQRLSACARASITISNWSRCSMRITFRSIAVRRWKAFGNLHIRWVIPHYHYIGIRRSYECSFSISQNRFRFTGECDNPDAQIRSCQTAGTQFLITNQKFNITYQKCQGMSGTFTGVVEYSCLGDWFVGKNHYFAVANTKESRKDEKYRCFLKNRDDDLYIGVSITAECNTLKTPEKSPERMRITPVKAEVVEAGCRLPQNFSGDWVNTANIDADVFINETHLIETYYPDRARYRRTIYVCKEQRDTRIMMARLTVDGWWVCGCRRKCEQKIIWSNSPFRF